MKDIKILTILGNGFEETEYVATRDALIREGIDVVSVSLEDTKEIVSNHNLRMFADKLVSEINLNDFDAVFIPGGPGTQVLGEKSDFDHIINHFMENGKHIAAICAAPTLLAQRGFLEGVKSVCYPSEELVNIMIMNNAKYQKDLDYIGDGRFFTGKNMQVSIEYGYALAKYLINRIG